MWNPFKKTDKEPKPKKDDAFQELGVAGAKMANGYVYDEFLTKLQSERGRKVFREMRDNDATINAIMFSIEMTIRGAEWIIVPVDDSEEANAAADFLETVMFDDMDHTWDDFIAEVQSTLTFGWSYFETVYKRRLGPDHLDPAKRSNFSDGHIGIRKIANRAQETLDRWNMDEQTGQVYGMYQQPPYGGGGVRYIPIEKALHFMAHSRKGSPEGVSALRGAYVAWFYLKRLQEIEAVGIERNLNGFPVISIPDEILNSNKSANRAIKQAYEYMGRDIRKDAQGSALIPSDTFTDNEGNPTSQPKVKIELLSTGSSSGQDVGKVILRYQRDIARTLVQDVLMLGSESGGSYALSKDKSSMSVKAIEGWLQSYAAVINRDLVTRLWKINGFDDKYKPLVKPGRIAEENLDKLGKYINDLTGSGMVLFPDTELENELRAAADLPDKPDNIEDILTGSDASDAVVQPNKGVE